MYLKCVIIQASILKQKNLDCDCHRKTSKMYYHGVFRSLLLGRLYD